MHVYNKLLMNLSEAENVYTLVYIEELSAKSLSLISLKPKKKKMKSNIKTGFLGIRINYERFKLVSISVGQVYIFVSFNKTC